MSEPMRDEVAGEWEKLYRLSEQEREEVHERLKKAEAANREKDAEIEGLRVFAEKAKQKVGEQFLTIYDQNKEIASLRASAGEKDAEIARLKEQLSAAETACEEGSEIVGEFSALRASGGEKWIDVKQDSSAKAAEEGVETMYRVDVADRIGWVMTAYDRFHKTQEAASNRANRAFTSVESIVRARVVCVETRETVIEVREKEGL